MTGIPASPSPRQKIPFCLEKYAFQDSGSCSCALRGMEGGTGPTGRVEDGLEAESPEVEEFFNLVEREAQRVQLLVRKNEKMPLTRNQVTWQPKFKMEDFSFPFKGPSTAAKSTPTTSSSCTKVSENDAGQGKEKRLLKLGLKRLRDSLDSGLQEETVKRKNCGDDGGLWKLSSED